VHTDSALAGMLGFLLWRVLNWLSCGKSGQVYHGPE
jgi:hypothetical protein